LDALATVPEDLAVDEFVDLYRDIKETLQVPVINLVWRHLASIDGALTQVWNCIKPIYCDEAFEAEAANLRDSDGVPVLPKWPQSTLREVRPGTSDEKILRGVLANYHQTNPRNLVALMALRAKLNGEQYSLGKARADIDSATPPPPRRNVGADATRCPPLNDIGINSTNAGIHAGIPRHLAHWLDFLQLSVAALSPYEHKIRTCIADVQRQATDSGRSLIDSLSEIRTGKASRQILSAVTLSTSRELIANYIVKVRMLQATLPE
jgi:hypothetical protein